MSLALRQKAPRKPKKSIPLPAPLRRSTRLLGYPTPSWLDVDRVLKLKRQKPLGLNISFPEDTNPFVNWGELGELDRVRTTKPKAYWDKHEYRTYIEIGGRLVQACLR